ncbi:hypothetical protein SBBP1_150008 [Burkholderiales bacterium]|nr:hypothetical protein SBBP1_150008 [Burkholderiales bacterium]
MVVALLWGTTFVAQKAANAHVGPIYFVAARFLAAAVFLLPLALREARRCRQFSTRESSRAASRSSCRSWRSAIPHRRRRC